MYEFMFMPIDGLSQISVSGTKLQKIPLFDLQVEAIPLGTQLHCCWAAIFFQFPS